MREAAEEEDLMRNEAQTFLNEIPEFDFKNKDWENKDKNDHGNILKQNRINFSTVAAVSLRYGASDRMTAAIATAALIDAKVITQEDASLVLDHHKVHREKVKLMAHLKEKDNIRYTEDKICCLFFDGRKNWTKVVEKDEVTGKNYQKMEKMEHIVVTSEPGGEYLFHFTPDEATKENKAAKQVAIKIVEWIKKHNITESLDSIGGDSTNSNTGKYGGTFTHIENMLGEKKNWIVCFLHTNELPLRHLMEELDGKTSSDHSFTGPVGKLLEQVTSLEINPNFHAVTIGLPLVDLEQNIIDDLSTDQKYGYQIVTAIRNGAIPDDLGKMEIGPLCHSRWLTFANRVLRLYVSKHGLKGKAAKDLKLLVEFIIGVYYHMWFEAKVNHSFINGPRLVLKQLQMIRLQDRKVQRIVAPYVASSAWFSHSESVLQTLLCSKNQDERKFAVNVILEKRCGSNRGDLSPRIREHAGAFNPDATELKELCAWDRNVFEPVLTCKLSLEEITEFINTPMVVPDKPVHGQSMERAVKQVTRACESVFGYEARDGFIRAGVASREVLPRNRTKSDVIRMAGCK